MSKVYEKEDFLTPSQCKLLIDYQTSHCINDLENWSSYNHDTNWKNRTVSMNNIDDLTVRRLVEVIHYKVSILCTRSYGVDYVYPEYSNLVYWGPGMSLGAHADNMWLDTPEKPHFASYRDYSAVINLNDNYEGGKTFFQDTGYEVEQKTGKLIYFTSGKDDAHGVTEVISGDRYTLGMWFTHTEDKLYLT